MRVAKVIPGGEIALYESAGGRIRLDVRLEQETVWLTQAQMGELFGRERSVITKHINNVFAEGELPKESNVQNLHIASSDKPVAFYSLDTIISIGYGAGGGGSSFRAMDGRLNQKQQLGGIARNGQSTG